MPGPNARLCSRCDQTCFHAFFWCRKPLSPTIIFDTHIGCATSTGCCTAYTQPIQRKTVFGSYPLQLLRVGLQLEGPAADRFSGSPSFFHRAFSDKRVQIDFNRLHDRSMLHHDSPRNKLLRFRLRAPRGVPSINTTVLCCLRVPTSIPYPQLQFCLKPGSCSV